MGYRMGNRMGNRMGYRMGNRNMAYINGFKGKKFPVPHHLWWVGSDKTHTAYANTSTFMAGRLSLLKKCQQNFNCNRVFRVLIGQHLQLFPCLFPEFYYLLSYLVEVFRLHFKRTS